MTTDGIINACFSGNMNVVKEILSRDPTFNNNWFINWAAEYGHLEVVKLLLADPRVDPSVNDNGPIRWASERGYLEIVKLLLQDPRVDPTAHDYEAIEFACINGHLEVVKVLISDPRVDSIDENIIRLATEHGRTKIVEFLTRHQYELNNAKYNSLVKLAN